VVEAAANAASQNACALKQGGRPATSPEIVLDALFWHLRNAGPWRDLPVQFGPWRTIYGWYVRWIREGVWSRILAELARRARGRLRFVDGTHVPVHQSGANPRGGAVHQAMGKTRGGRNCKIMALTDVRGRLVALRIVAGQSYEGRYVPGLLADQPGSVIVVGDKGFDSDPLRRQLEAQGHDHCLKRRANRKSWTKFHCGYYRLRPRVEHFFCRLKRWASIATRRDKLALHYKGLVVFAAVIDWLQS
jgi:transposase